MKNIIFIHGAWHGGWCWKKIEPYFSDDEYNVLFFDIHSSKNPDDDMSFEGSINLLKEKIEKMTGDVILVAHSMGGMYATQVSEYFVNKISKIIYVSGFIPKDNQSCLDLALNDVGIVKFGLIFNDAKTLVTVDEKIIRPAFYNDVSEDDYAFCRKNIKPQNFSHYTTKVKLASDNSKKTTRIFIRCMRDMAITPGFQTIMALENGCDIYDLDSGHSPFVSKVNEFVDLIKKF